MIDYYTYKRKEFAMESSESVDKSSSSGEPQLNRQQPHASSTSSPLLAETAATPNQDAFEPEDDWSAKKAKRLKEFTSEELLNALCNRGVLYKCYCGAIFKDCPLYHLHRGSHHDEDPTQCSFCRYKSKDWYDFQTHFLEHKNTKANND